MPATARSRRHISLVLIATPLAISLLLSGRVFAQIPPGSLTNRPLGHLDDATATAWNPALLGVGIDHYDIIAAGSFNPSLSFRQMFYALFGKLGPIGIGSTGPLGDSVAEHSKRQYHVAAGVPIIDDLLWAGAGTRWTDGLGFLGSAELSVSGLFRPRPDLFAGLTIGNLTANNGADPWAEAQTSFAATSWMTLFAGARFDRRDTVGELSALSPSLGVSLGAGDNTLILTGSFDFNRTLGRVGLEAQLGNVTFGSLNGIDEHGGFAGGVALSRWSSHREISIGELIPDEDDDASMMGWAPERAFVPAGLEYTRPASNNDAVRNQASINLPCTVDDARRFDSPAGLAAIVEAAGAAYSPLAAKLRSLAPRPEDVLRAIRRRFYSPSIRNRELSTGDTLSILSRDGHSISIQAVDAERFPMVSVIMRVTDEHGRTVAGLGSDAFTFRDTAMKIVSVRPTDSTFNVPVDIMVLIDCSGSMSSQIESVRQNVEQFVDNLSARGIDYRIGGVLYGSLVYDTLHPTSSIASYKQFLSRAAAIGGDEITTLAVKTATEMNFRSAAQRVFIMITDDWAVQNNSRLDEAQLTEMLWDTRARLYSIITPCKNNGAVMTRLTLGREFDIRLPFTSILNEISADLTTAYELVYESQERKEVVVPAVTILRGRIRDDSGAPVPATFDLGAGNTSMMRIATNPTTAEYETEIAEGATYLARLRSQRHHPLDERIDLTGVTKGDTITRDFVLRIRQTTVSGRITDEKGRPINADVRIEDATTLERIDTIVATNGLYEVTLEEGRIYRLTPSARNYIPFPGEVDARVEKGTALSHDLRVMSIDAAIASGAVFRLKNIFFDYDRADLKPESFGELDRLVALLEEYPVIKVEIGAHTDGKGSDRYNETLSARRAQSVREYLVERGIAPSRLSSMGYGESVPVASNDTDEGRALNRRVEFKLVR